MAVALLHFLVVGLGPLVDARLEASENKAVAHVEAEQAAPCAPGHDHFFCQVCRAVSQVGVSPSGLARAIAVAPAASQPARDAFSPAQSLLDLLAHGPRAPPLA